MGRQWVLVSVLVCVLAASASAATHAYFVEPKTAACGWTPEDEFVGQTFVANVDSIAYIEWFVGELSAEGRYKFEVSLNGQAVFEGYESVPARGWQWVRCDSFGGDLRFTKGKEYLLKVSHDGGDSVCFVYRTDDPYEWGEISVGGGGWGQPEPVQNCDLCLRVYGVMDAVDSTYWGFNVGNCEVEQRETVADMASDAGVGMDRMGINWNSVENGWPGDWDLELTGGNVQYRHCTIGSEMVGLLVSTPKWASSHIDTMIDPELGQIVDTSTNAPPINLWASYPEEDSGQQLTNYWARFVDSVVTRWGSGDGGDSSIRVWQCWNEPNWRNRFWEYPTYFYGLDTSAYASCSLYMKLCEVAAGVIHGADGGHVVLIGSMSQTESVPEGRRQVAGKEWLRMCYEVAAQTGCGVFWDGVAIHPYQGGETFDPLEFEADAETLRAIMRGNGDYGGLWITELGWSTGSQEPLDPPHCEVSDERQADQLCQSFAVARASEANPAGGYDRMCWYRFLDDGQGFGLLDTLYEPKPSLYASGQTRDALVGKRLNGRVLTGDSDVDNATRIYEFEDPDDGKRLWVCWKNGGAGVGEVDLAVPARCDTVDTVPLNYGPNLPLNTEKACATDFWLQVKVGEQPVFVTEPSAKPVSRPDLRADSVWFVSRNHVVGYIDTLKVKVKNSDDADSRATPLNCTTWVHFTWNGSTVGIDWHTDTIGKGDSVIISCPVNGLPGEMTGTGLLSGHPNKYQGFVELGWDDNAACRLDSVRPYPRGELDGQGNTGRLVRQAGGAVLRAFTWDDPAGDYVGLDRTTDCGETWLHLGSPGLGSNPALGYDSDSVACLAWLRNDSLLCSFRGYDAAWTPAARGVRGRVGHQAGPAVGGTVPGQGRDAEGGGHRFLRL